MKTPIDSASAGAGATVALLNGSSDFQYVDLWAVTLNGGAVIRWHSGPWNTPITFAATSSQSTKANGTYLAGPLIDRGKISVKSGLEVATMDVVISATLSDLINGAPVIPFARGNGFDGATVVLYRAWYPTWGGQITGLTIQFSGRVTQLKDVSGVQLTMTVSAWTVLLNVNMGPDVYQAGCLNTHYDANCGLPITTTGTAAAGGSATTFGTSLTGLQSGYFNSGTITFTSGANAGATRVISSYSATSGTVTVASAFAHTPSSGDSFSITIQIPGTVGAGGTTLAFDTNLSQADGYFTQGVIAFLTGANAGLSRAVQAYANASGLISVAFPLPFAPANGDTFVVVRGCALTLPACQAQRPLADAMTHFRGQPYTPAAVNGITGLPGN